MVSVEWPSVTLILGGARSGKSRYAEQMARSLSARPVYVATSRAWDDDHRARIARHQRDRPACFRTIEADLMLSALPVERAVVVVDCVTLWLTNWFVDLEGDVEACRERVEQELRAVLARENVWIFVSNELGQSLHAPTEAGRKFVDLQGFVNQHIAARADAVALMVAGIPWFVKGAPPAGAGSNS